MSVAPLEDLAVSVYLPDPTGPATYHYFAQQSNYLTAGDHVTDTSDAAFRTRTPSWYFLDGLEVLGAYKRAGVVVAYGDSITDGIGSAGNLNDRWPDFLARRLDSRYGNQAPAVIDEGIGGNRVLNPSACYGQSAVTRFSRDVLDQTGVRAVIVLEGINDIGYSEDADRGCESAEHQRQRGPDHRRVQEDDRRGALARREDIRRHDDPVRERLDLVDRGPGQVAGRQQLDPHQRRVRRRLRLRPRGRGSERPGIPQARPTTAGTGCTPTTPATPRWRAPST